MGTKTALPSRVSNSVQTRLISGRELWEMGDSGPAELISGEIVYQMPAGRLHGRIESFIVALLLRYLLKNPNGEVYSGEVGIYTRRNPDSVRAADVVFISNQRLQQVQTDGYLEIAPDLVLEVMSPGDRWSDVHEKLKEYFAIGVKLVWVFEPKREQIRVYRSPDDFIRLTRDEQLTAEEILPDFRVKVGAIFQFDRTILEA
jgi:Uma2 family endonuclease